MNSRLQNVKKVLLPTVKILFATLLLISAYFLLKEMPIRHHGWIYRDKVEHAALFFTLTVLALFLFKHYRFMVIVLLLSYGGLTEYLQSTITKTRTGSIADWLADIAGVCLGCLFVWGVVVFAKRNQQ